MTGESYSPFGHGPRCMSIFRAQEVVRSTIDERFTVFLSKESKLDGLKVDSRLSMMSGWTMVGTALVTREKNVLFNLICEQCYDCRNSVNFN